MGNFLLFYIKFVCLYAWPIFVSRSTRHRFEQILKQKTQLNDTNYLIDEKRLGNCLLWYSVGLYCWSFRLLTSPEIPRISQYWFTNELLIKVRWYSVGELNITIYFINKTQQKERVY